MSKPKFWIFIGCATGMPLAVEKCTFAPTILPGNGSWVEFVCIDEVDMLRAEYQAYKVHYDRIFETSIVVPSDEYSKQCQERHALKETEATLRHELKMMHPEYQRMKDENAIFRAALEEIADLTNPNEVKYISWPTSKYMTIAREALGGKDE